LLDSLLQERFLAEEGWHQQLPERGKINTGTVVGWQCISDL